MLRISSLILKGQDMRTLSTVSNGKHVSLSFEDLGSVLGAPTKLANHSDIQKSEICREFYFSYYSD